MMKKLCCLLALCSMAIILLVACGSSGSASNASGNQVHMSNTNFVQSSITLRKGESVTLVADTLMTHPIKNGTWENGEPQPSQESGAPVINVVVRGNSSETIGPFTNVGSFKLYCTAHPGMNLTVIVQ